MQPGFIGQDAERRGAAHRNAELLGRLGAVAQHQRTIRRVDPRPGHHTGALGGAGLVGGADTLGDVLGGEDAFGREQSAHRREQAVAVGAQQG